ncbi:SDR family oxidoreductase [Streptomyces sp. AV19]|uniref:SDR family oxidoreductase n=1 Tax=Streptomyces sp. AV19 TaxID=2793068 RepID=UPI0018FE35D9|nr:SDR family oxidoreductase [Streptomyces sp. AV19]MBH1934808.1 SDR family oxidoreductase [Streptomyces sp. AV19]MDG4530587.1 SDR family oxidoreductase [Streptomyces sp. AV19]
MRVQNAVVLVTGANRGIGSALVTAFLERGAARVHAGARDPGTLAAVTARDPERIRPLALDITDPTSVTSAALTAPDVTLLVNNAGVHVMGHLLEMDLRDVETVMNTNWLGTLRVLRAFAPVVERNGGGAVVNVISVGAFGGTPSMGGYPASKAALNALTQAVRPDLAPRGIAVHAVYPGPVDTDMLRLAANALPRMAEFPRATTADVARAIIEGVEADTQEIFPDPFAEQLGEEWRRDPKAVERRLTDLA